MQGRDAGCKWKCCSNTNTIYVPTVTLGHTRKGALSIAARWSGDTCGDIGYTLLTPNDHLQSDCMFGGLFGKLNVE